MVYNTDDSALATHHQPHLFLQLHPLPISNLITALTPTDMYGSTSRSGESDYDGATAVGDSASFVPRPSPTKRGNAFLTPEYPLKPKAAPVIQHVDDLPFVDSATYFEKER